MRNRFPAGEKGDYFAFSADIQAPSYVAALQRQLGVVLMGRALVRNVQCRHAAFLCCVLRKAQATAARNTCAWILAQICAFDANANTWQVFGLQTQKI